MSLTVGDTIVGPEVKGGWPHIYDERDQDIPMLLKQYPLLRRGEFVFNIFSFPEVGKSLECPCP